MRLPMSIHFVVLLPQHSEDTAVNNLHLILARDAILVALMIIQQRDKKFASTRLFYYQSVNWQPTVSYHKLPNDYVTTHKAPSTQSQFSRSNNQVFTQPTTYGQSAPLSTHYNSRHSTPNSILSNNAQSDAHEPSLTVMRATLNPLNNPVLPIETT